MIIFPLSTPSSVIFLGLLHYLLLILILPKTNQNKNFSTKLRPKEASRSKSKIFSSTSALFQWEVLSNLNRPQWHWIHIENLQVSSKFLYFLKYSINHSLFSFYNVNMATLSKCFTAVDSYCWRKLNYKLKHLIIRYLQTFKWTD